MNQESITLDWQALINASKISYQQNMYGIYIWGFTIDNEFIPYYVGIADNIFSRIMEHISSIISGKYVIYHNKSLGNFTEYKNQDANINNTHGKVYSPNWPIEYVSFINKRKELQTHIDYMVDTFAFSYAKLDQGTISKKDLKEIEKICINQIGKENLQNSKSGFSNRFNINHSGNNTIIEKIKSL
ncbi:hypothetical protein ACFLRY_02990 [Bacteroidota bacterium]